ncbi:MAG TPA: HAMP domain-containing sensor histidine kinase [Solirubrobacteraceae bacterium]|nr:HAMP domain-containing sensor histidine kinase [Solirubrobacteraceae bacterium]
MSGAGAEPRPETPRPTGRRRLGWRARGLRYQIVGSVLVTTVVTLVVAAIVLLPQLEQSLRTASEKSLYKDIVNAHGQVTALARLDYTLLPLLSSQFANAPGLTRELLDAQRARTELAGGLTRLKQRLGTDDVYLIGYIDASGHGRLVAPGLADASADATLHDSFTDVSASFLRRAPLFRPMLSFGHLGGQQVVRATIRLPDDAVIAVRKSIDEIPTAARAVARSFEVAALAGLLLTGLLAIPLAATLARRLQHLREAAQRVAVEGASAEVPVDRARDEVGDLSRSFAIMQRRLVQQEEARRAFVATASHELRTPLASLEGMLELAADDLTGPQPDVSDATALLERARAQSRRLSRLAADLLDLSRIDAAVPLRSEPVELSEIVRAVLAEFELSLAEHRVHGEVGGATGAVWVRADPGKVAQILRILLDNALRVAPPESAITVLLDSEGLTVSDQGPGVAPAERELIFERFQRGAATGGEAGFGLGLAIGRELARRMHGELALAESGTGAAFRLALPAAAASEELDTAAALPVGRA